MFLFFFFNDTATTEIYTLSLHDALPIYPVDIPHAGRRAVQVCVGAVVERHPPYPGCEREGDERADRKSTRLNSSHSQISYAVFCLKKKKNRRRPIAVCRGHHHRSSNRHC